MSWGNQGGGSWRPGQGPWGQGPGANKPVGDLEDMIRRFQDSLRSWSPGGGIGMRGALVFALIAVLLWLLWGFYTVQPNEVGINLLFGLALSPVHVQLVIVVHKAHSHSEALVVVLLFALSSLSLALYIAV